MRYVIAVERKGSGNAVRLEAGGKPIDGNVIPLPADGTKEAQVKVYLGA